MNRVARLSPAALLSAILPACSTYPPRQAEQQMDTHAEVPASGDETNRANGPVGSGAL